LHRYRPKGRILTSLRLRINTGTGVCVRTALGCALLLLVLPLVCCAQATPPAAEVTLRQEFKLRLGQTIRVKGEGLKVRFTSVVEDSRCPKGEQCIWQGNAKIRLEVTKGEDKPVTFELSTEPGPQEATHLNYALKFVALDPYPGTGGQPAPEEYQATLAVDKNAPGHPGGDSTGNTGAF
jgi:hypothetical protein